MSNGVTTTSFWYPYASIAKTHTASIPSTKPQKYVKLEYEDMERSSTEKCLRARYPNP